MMSQGNRLTSFRNRFGPGMLFAAAAVGTSHLVQSTRAGASFGLTLAGLILVVCVLKYPLFRFATEYAALTGEGMVAGYMRRGRGLVYVVCLAAAIEAVAATAGVSLVTAAIARWLFGIDIGAAVGAVVLLAITMPIAAFGRYRLLESVSTVLVVGFTLFTVIATVASVGALIDDTAPSFGHFAITRQNAAFAVAVSGWMPIGNIASIMLASWVLAKRQALNMGGSEAAAHARFDFNVGYITSTVLAICFLAMGAAVFFSRESGMPASSVAFVTAFVQLYTKTVGSWSMWIVSIAALGVMYSTLLAIVDGFPRLLGEFLRQLGWVADHHSSRHSYLISMVAVTAAACLVLFFFMKSFASFIDVVTTLGFLVAPVVALANQLVICGPNVPVDQRPSRALIVWNVLAVIVMIGALIGFVVLR